jgi:hypothetical protein
MLCVQTFELSFFKGISKTSSLFGVGMDAGRDRNGGSAHAVSSAQHGQALCHQQYMSN